MNTLAELKHKQISSNCELLSLKGKTEQMISDLINLTQRLKADAFATNGCGSESELLKKVDEKPRPDGLLNEIHEEQNNTHFLIGDVVQNFQLICDVLITLNGVLFDRDTENSDENSSNVLNTSIGPKRF